MAKCKKTKTKILHNILSCRWPSEKNKDKDKDTARHFILQMAKCKKTKTKILHDILSCRWPSEKKTKTKTKILHDFLSCRWPSAKRQRYHTTFYPADGQVHVPQVRTYRNNPTPRRALHSSGLPFYLLLSLFHIIH